MSTDKRGVYTVTSLSGAPMTEGEIREALAEVATNKTFRALVKIIENELLEMRDKASDPTFLKDGTQPHWNGAVDGLNGALLRIAEAACPAPKRG